MKFKGWNIFLSYSQEQDKAARKNGWGFLGFGKDNSQREVKLYRMWKLKDGPPEKNSKEEKREDRESRKERKKHRKKHREREYA